MLNPVTYTDAARKSYIRIRHMLTHTDATHTYTHIRMRHIRTHTYGCDTYVHTHMDSAHTRTHTGSAGVLDPVTSKLCEFEDGDNLLERIDDIYVRLDKDGSGARGCVGTPLVFPQAKH